MKNKELLEILKDPDVKVTVQIRNTTTWVEVDKKEVIPLIKKTKTVDWVGFKKIYSLKFY